MATLRNNLGRLCVERGLLTEEQLAQCLRIQQSGKAWRPLGEILLDQGFLSGRALATLLNVQEANRGAAGAAPGAAETGERPPSNQLGWLLKEMRASGADSLVLATGQPPFFRYCGHTHRVDGPSLQDVTIRQMLGAALPAGTLGLFDETGALDRTIEIPHHGRVRFTVYRHAAGIAATVRQQVSAGVKLATLHLPGGVRALARHRSGLVLITGPQSSSRVVTLNALLNEIASTRPSHIMTLERPVETWLEPGRSRLTRREVGRDCPGFAEGIASALRAGADVVVVGAMDDAATINGALGAASTGRLVVGLMHTNGACATVERILDSSPGGYSRGLLASCLRGVLTQHLMVSRDGQEPVMAVELLLCTAKVVPILREGRTDRLYDLLRTGHVAGMVSLDESLLELCRQGSVSVQDALARAVDPESLERALKEGAHVGA